MFALRTATQLIPATLQTPSTRHPNIFARRCSWSPTFLPEGFTMKRLLCVLPFFLAACDAGTIAPTGVMSPAASTASMGKNTCTLVNGNVVATGFDANGYNRCAGIFNGTMAGYCADRGQGPTCAATTGDTKLVMKWNAGWDLGNFEHWSNPPYDATIDNEFNGAYTDGTPFSEHFKAHWDLGCKESGGLASFGGGSCVWGQFEILMDQGTEDGAHIWWEKMSPAGFGS